MKREDLRVNRDDLVTAMWGEQPDYRPTTDEDLASLGYVKVFDVCGECDDGWIPCPNARGVPHSVVCPVCDGSGKVLKDGAMRFPESFVMNMPDPQGFLYAFPASWLEGASDET